MGTTSLVIPRVRKLKPKYRQYIMKKTSLGEIGTNILVKFKISHFSLHLF